MSSGTALRTIKRLPYFHGRVSPTTVPYAYDTLMVRDRRFCLNTAHEINDNNGGHGRMSPSVVPYDTLMVRDSSFFNTVLLMKLMVYDQNTTSFHFYQIVQHIPAPPTVYTFYSSTTFYRRSYYK